MSNTATLFIVSTPIGNLKDISFRAIETLKSSELILCEDKRISQNLLNHYGIKVPLLAYNLINEKKLLPHVLEKLNLGVKISLISDGGTPLISDPGFLLVKECKKNNIKISPVPGACSLIAALSVSALPLNGFYFHGFFPLKNTDKEKLVEKIKNTQVTSCFFESPKRLLTTLTFLEEFLGESQEIVVVRELTKIYEEVKHGTIKELISYYEDNPIKGEVIVLLPPLIKKEELSDKELDDLIKEYLKTYSVKELSEKISIIYSLNKKTIYNKALQLKNNE